MSRGAPTKTPVRAALKPESTLLAAVENGLDGVIAVDKDRIEPDLRPAFGDSLNLDEAVREGHQQENRWDYLLGHTARAVVVGLEPHAAREDQVSTVIAKRRAAIVHLRPHLQEGVRVAAWFWVSSGSVQFADTEKARRRLDQNGIQFVGRQLGKKHLDALK